jgi:hypothetical protein
MSSVKPDYEAHERDVVAALGGRASKSSGRGKFSKGDGTAGDVSQSDAVLWDAKCTSKELYRLTHDTWYKVWIEASMSCRSAIIPVRFVGKDGKKVLRDLVVVAEYDYAQLLPNEPLCGNGMFPESTPASTVVTRDMAVPCHAVVHKNHSWFHIIVMELDEYARSRRKAGGGG